MKLRGRRRAAWGVLAGAVIAAAWLRLGPLPPEVLEPHAGASVVVVDRAGQPLYEALSGNGSRSRPLRPDALPTLVARATLAAEDHRFYRHPGVDPLAIARALWHALRAGALVEGGSTITQQTVKMLIQRPRTARGKMREVVYALRLEQREGKDEILARYLTIAPYGNQYAGVEAAAEGYFGVAAAELTPAQAALLAALPQRPSALDPRRHLERALVRQRWILGRMEELGWLSAAQAAEARAERLQVRPAEPAFGAPHFVERVLQEHPGGVARVETTLDGELQEAVRGIVSAHRARLQKHGAHNVAVAVLDNVRGEWLAWEGSGDWTDAEHGGTIDGVVSPRQPGSALKPFTYALAFEQGRTPAAVLPDVPAHFQTAVEGVLYSPRNYDGVFRGPMRARVALAGSENVPAVWLLSQAGVPDLLRLLRRAGLTTLDKTPEHYGYGLTMGDAEVRLDELVAAYAALARGGVHLPPRKVTALVGADGVRLDLPRPSPQAILGERSSFWVGDILADRQARRFAFGEGGSLDFPFPVSVKTGTSQAYRDNWTVGFTRELTVGVWVGNFDRTPLRNSSGVTGAAPIFHDVMLAALSRLNGALPPAGDGPWREPPDSLEPRRICALSGHAPTRACPVVATEWLPREAEDVVRSCPWHRETEGRTVVAWPPPYRAWARERGLLDSRAWAAAAPAPPRAPGRVRRAAVEPDTLAIVSPPDGSTFLKDPTLRDEFQTLALRAAAGPSSGRLSWEVDGAPVGETTVDGHLDWPLRRGPHTIRVTDATGRRDEAAILVK
jgi:penicillin-binding protein 1C